MKKTRLRIFIRSIWQQEKPLWSERYLMEIKSWGLIFPTPKLLMELLRDQRICRSLSRTVPFPVLYLSIYRPRHTMEMFWPVMWHIKFWVMVMCWLQVSRLPGRRFHVLWPFRHRPFINWRSFCPIRWAIVLKAIWPFISARTVLWRWTIWKWFGPAM